MSLLQKSGIKAASKETQLPADSATAADPVASSLRQPQQPGRVEVLHRPATIPAKLQQLADRDSQRRSNPPAVEEGEPAAGLARGIKAEWQLPRRVPGEGISDHDGLHEFGIYQPLPSVAANPQLQQTPSEGHRPTDGRSAGRSALQALGPPNRGPVGCESSHGWLPSDWEMDAQTATSDRGPEGPRETYGSVGDHGEPLSRAVWPARSSGGMQSDAAGQQRLMQPGRQLLPTAAAIGRHAATSAGEEVAAKSRNLAGG